MIVRPMYSEDAEGVTDVYLRTVQAAYRQLVEQSLLPSDESRDDLIAFYRSFAGAGSPILVAETEYGLSGFCRIKERPKKTCEISQLYVLPDVQGRGIGKKFIQHLGDLDSYQRLKLLVIQGNKPALHFYSRVGFIPTGIQKFLPQFQVQEIELEKNVGSDKK